MFKALLIVRITWFGVGDRRDRVHIAELGRVPTAGFPGRTDMAGRLVVVGVWHFRLEARGLSQHQGTIRCIFYCDI